MKKRKWLCMALCVLLVWAVIPALAEDCFTIDVDTLDMNSLNSDEYVAQYLSASAQGVRVKKYISDSSELAAPVRLTLMQMDSQTLLFDKDYGLQSGTFDSGVIYLPYVADRTIPYLVTLTIGDYVYAMPFMHLQARLVANNACTYGVRLNDLAVAFYGDWMMGTMVDLNALASQGSMGVDICASNRYVIGQATVSMQGSSLCVSLSFNSQANVAVQSQSVWVVTNCADFAAGVQPPSHQPGEWVDVSGASSALIVLSLRVDYDTAGLPAFHYDLSSSQLQSQLSLWEQNRAGGQSTGGQSADGWSDGSTESFTFSEGVGWIDNSGWVDNGGWYDDGSGWVDDGSGWTDDGSGWVDDGSGWTDGGSGWVDDGSGWTDGGSGWVDNGGWTDGGSGWVDGGGSTNGGTGWVDNGGWTDDAAANF
ncbi:MAG: hypothetical protein MR742_04385 [Clostridiales bacterium]|nr:hypothetical protein [Clostridiales bacterium]